MNAPHYSTGSLVSVPFSSGAETGLFVRYETVKGQSSDESIYCVIRFPGSGLVVSLPASKVFPAPSQEEEHYRQMSAAALRHSCETHEEYMSAAARLGLLDGLL